MNEFLNACVNANKEVYELIKSTPHDKLCQKTSVGEGGDMGRYVDKKAEEIFVKHLSSFGQIYSEESGVIGDKSEYKIIIDPIDGSDNFVNKVPYFGSSVALKKDDETINSAICNLANSEIFIKYDEDLYKSSLEKNDFTKVKNNDFSTFGIVESSYKSKIFTKKLKNSHIKYRSLGALALSLAYAKNVDFVLYEGKVREFDVCAGLHFCSNLNLMNEKNYLFVSKDKQIFDKIHQIIF